MMINECDLKPFIIKITLLNFKNNGYLQDLNTVVKIKYINILMFEK